MVIGILYFAGTVVYASEYYDSSPTWFKVVMLLLLIATVGYALWQEEKTKYKITELEAKVSELQPYFTPEQVRRMTPEEVRKNYTAIMKSMEKWN